MHEWTHVSGWGCRGVVLTLCADLYLFEQLQTNCCILLWGSEALVCPGWHPTSVGTSQGAGTSPVSQLPPWGTGPNPVPFSLSFVFCSTRLCLCGDFLVLSEVWGLPPAFSRYSVRTVQHVDVFLMYLWEEVSFMFLYSAILITAPYLIFKTVPTK